jgi:hypothetical protein
MRLKGPSLRKALSLATVLVLYASLASLGAENAFKGTGAAPAAQAAGASQQQVLGASGESGTQASDSGPGTGASALATTAGSTAGGPSATGPGSVAAAGVAAGGRTAAGAAGGPILVGIHDDDPGAAYAAYGVNGQPGDQEAWVNKMVAWINAHGGMGGRQLVTVPHVTQNLNGSFDQQAQEACTDFTEDHHVVAVVAAAKVPTFNEPDCLAAHKTPLVWEFDVMATQSDFDHYGPYLYEPAFPSGDRLGVWIDAVADRGFFNGGKIGILRYDTPQSGYLDNNVIRPRLAAHGLSVTDEFAYNNASGASSAADLSAQSNSAILRFRSAGINRVIFEPSTNIIPLIFITAAKASGYRPTYTWSGFDSATFEEPNASADQLAGTLVFGWHPSLDVDESQQPPSSPASSLCLSLTSDAKPPGNSSVRRFCDGLFFLKALFDHGAQPNPESMQATAEALGTSWDSPFAMRTAFGPRRHDGASVGRLSGYDTGCSCFKYVSGDIPIP